jgi:methyl-accepting chemotaxis protein
MILLSFWSFNIWQGQRLPAPVMVTILFVMFTNVAGIYVVAVLTTQRIAGPIFNLIRQFSELSQHNFSARARFRRKDELQYVALRFNEMAECIEERDKQIFQRLRHLQDCVAPGVQLPADSSVLASQIHDELSQLLGDGIFRNAHGGDAVAPQALQGEQG